MGTCDGHLYVFENGATVLTRSVKAHTGAVYTLHPVYPAATTGAAAAAAPASGSSFSNAGQQQDRDSGGDLDGEGETQVPIGFWSGGKDGLVKFFDGQVGSRARTEWGRRENRGRGHFFSLARATAAQATANS